MRHTIILPLQIRNKLLKAYSQVKNTYNKGPKLHSKIMCFPYKPLTLETHEGIIEIRSKKMGLKRMKQENKEVGVLGVMIHFGFCIRPRESLFR